MEKKTSLFENGLIWFGAGVSIAEILTGTYFSGLGLKTAMARSEERRLGKECRSRWSPYH